MFSYYHRGRGCNPRGRGGPWDPRRWDRIAEEITASVLGGGGHGGGRKRRLFDGGELRLLLLKLIAETPRHGYDLIREIEERTSGTYAPSPGVVYPTLTLLVDMGLIEEAASDGARKLFQITDTGAAHLQEKADDVEAIVAKLSALGAERQRSDAAPVRRAVGNLREVLQHRLRRDDTDADLIHRVTALIDEAAQKIERL